MDITGKVKAVFKTQTVSDKFKKRDFVLTDDSSQYPQHISFQLTQDKCSLLDDVKEGSTIKVFFNLRGREWSSPTGETKYFNTLEAWRIEKNANEAPPTTEAAEQAYSASVETDNLPF